MSETKYEPGTVAEVGWQMTSGKERAMFDGWYWHTESGVTVRTPESVRPLVVLDLDGYAANELASWLDGTDAHMSIGDRLRVAREIRRQTQPTRIPEPGLWGVVEAGVEQHDVRLRWVKLGPDHYRSDDSDEYDRMWNDLIDPTLVREGVSE